MKYPRNALYDELHGIDSERARNNARIVDLLLQYEIDSQQGLTAALIDLIVAIGKDYQLPVFKEDSKRGRKEDLAGKIEFILLVNKYLKEDDRSNGVGTACQALIDDGVFGGQSDDLKRKYFQYLADQKSQLGLAPNVAERYPDASDSELKDLEHDCFIERLEEYYQKYKHLMTLSN